MIKIHPIDCGNMMVDGGAMFGVIPKTMWNKKYDCDERNLCNISMRSLLIEMDNQLILIDSGTGDKQDEAFFRFDYRNGDGDLIKSIDKLGFKAEDITDVVHTHLHFDHCGGTLKLNERGEIVPTFPNATLWVSKVQWDWAIKPNKREKPAYPAENILPMQDTGKLKFIEKEGELFPGFEVFFANGHTRGQVIPIIHTPKQSFAFCGDLIPTMANVPLSFIAAFDLFQLDVLEEKERFLKRAAKENWVLIFEHDIKTECCRVEEGAKGVVAVNPSSIEEVNLLA